MSVAVSASASVIFSHRMLIWHKEMLLFAEKMEIMAELTFCGNFFTLNVNSVPKNMTQNQILVFISKFILFPALVSFHFVFISLHIKKSLIWN